MIKSLALTIATSILAISTAFAADLEASIPEGCKGFPEQLIQNPEQLKIAQEKVSQQFTQELIEIGAILEQTQHYFYDDILEGNQEAIKTAKAFNKYFKEKFNKLTFLKDLYEGHKGVNVPQFDFEMQDKPPAEVGKHYLLTQEIVKIDSKIKDLQRQKDEAEKIPQLVRTEENTEKEQQPQENTKLKEIEAEIAKLQSQKEELTFQADLYALTKFIIYRNFYDSLPNEENGAEDFCQVTSPFQEDFLLQLMQYQKENDKTIAEKLVNDIVSSYKIKQIADNISSLVNSYQVSCDKAQEIARSIVNNLNESATPFKRDLVKLTKPYISTADFTYQTNRADLLLIKRVNTWKARVSKKPGMLVERFGFMSSLYNTAFNTQSERILFSFTELAENSDTLKGNLEKLKETDKKQVYQMGETQLKLNFEWDDVTVTSVVKPISKFLTGKLESLGNKQEEQGTYKRFVDQNNDLAAQYALAKFASYQAMSYALTHEPAGEALPELNMVPSGFESFMKVPEAFLRLDNVFNAKAYKWGMKLKESHPDFLETNGLAAAYF